jgi:hypothetical protein
MLCAVSEPADGSGPSQGKGRPTPKRRDAQKRRRQPMPGNQKEAAKLRRERVRETRALQRKALRSGDEKFLPGRDAGPGKRLARDIVDSRFTVGQVFFGLILVTFFAAVATGSSSPKHNAASKAASKAVKQANTLGALVTAVSIVVLIAVFTDSIRVGRRARRAVEEKYGVKQSLGITGYAAMRAMQPRRMRRPPPSIKRGDPLR